jgi:hypothetical protein
MSLEFEFNNDNPDFDLATRYQEIQKLLWEHQCEVTFTKVDGSVRTMPCTLMASALPARDASKLHETRLHDPKAMSVWCLDKSEWRSFRTANVTHIRVLS